MVRLRAPSVKICVFLVWVFVFGFGVLSSPPALVLTCMCIFPVFYSSLWLNVFILHVTLWLTLLLFYKENDWLVCLFVYCIRVSIDRCDWPHTDLLTGPTDPLSMKSLSVPPGPVKISTSATTPLWALHVPPTWTFVFLLFETIVSVFILLWM